MSTDAMPQTNTSASGESDEVTAARFITDAQFDALSDAEQQRVIGLLRAANRARRPAEPPPPPVTPPPDPAVLAAVRAGEPIGLRLVSDDEADEWVVAVLSARRRAEGAAGDAPPRWPTASEYARWSDERIAELRLDPEQWAGEVEERDPIGLDADDLRALPGADDVPLDVHPFNPAVELVEAMQAGLCRAEAGRVLAALSAYRIAIASNTTDPDPAGSLFHAAVMMQLAHSMDMAERTAAAMVHTAERLERDLPETWRHFVAGEVAWRRMQKAHAAIDGMDGEFLPEFDRRAAEIVTTAVAGRVAQRLHELRERLQARTAVDRHAKALARRHVELDVLPDGMAAVTNVMPAAEAILMRAGVHEQAVAAKAVPGETRTIAQIESDLLTDYWVQGIHTAAPEGVPDITVPTRRPSHAKVALLLPAMTALGHSDVPAVLEGYGPIDIETAKRLAGAATSWVKVLTDPVTGAVLTIGRTKYEPTADMRTLLGLLDRAGRGPNTTPLPERCEVDHVTPFRQHFARGQTAIDNLVLLAKRDHAVKTKGWFDIELRGRALVWTSFAGTRIITTVETLEPTPVPAAA